MTSVGHQRLPAEDRRHPVVSLGAVAAAARRFVRGLCTPHRGAPSSIARSRSASIRRPSRCCCRTHGWRAHRPAGRRARRRRSSCSTLRCRSASIGPRLRHPYGVVLHGAEVTVPGRLPAMRQLLGTCVARRPTLVVAAGRLSGRAERRTRRARRCRSWSCRPGVDVDRFRPLVDAEIDGHAIDLGLPTGRPLVVGGEPARAPQGLRHDVARRGAGRGRRYPDLVVAIAGAGTRPRPPRAPGERARCAHGAFLGRVPDDDAPAALRLRRRVRHALPRPVGRARARGLRHRLRRGRGRRACAQLAGASGGAAEAVQAGVTGFVIDPPTDVQQVSVALVELLRDPELRRRMGSAARARAVREFRYDVLAERLAAALDAVV